MESIRKPARWLLLVTALAMLAAACGGGGEAPSGEEAATEDAGETEAAAEGEPQEGGTVVYGADQEPAVLIPVTTEGYLFANGLLSKALLADAYDVLPDFTYAPDLLDGEAEVSNDGRTVTYRIKEEATWSDGTPVTADDFLFTADVYNNEDFDISARDGYNLIEEQQAVDDKTAEFTFEEPFAPYKTLFAPVLPSHELEGKNIDRVWNDEITVASGPFEFDSWQKGQQLTIKRNENYWGETKAKLDEIILRFITDSNAQVQALEGDEIDMFYPQPQVDLVEQVEAIDGIESETNAGTVWEHIDFNFAVPPLDQAYVRQAIAYGIDRAALTEQLIKPLNPDAEPLQNTIYMNNQEEYEPHFDEYTYDPDQATQLLEDNGCTMGDDDIYTCDGEKLSFTYATTTANELRELTQQVVQQQLQEIGVEVKAANEDADALFGTTLPGGADGAWELIMFAWVGSPDPFGGNSIYTCDGGLNEQGYCNEEVTELINSTNTMVDEAERAATYNEADALMSEDIPILPLYQKPTYFAWKDTIVGPQDNPTQWGPFWNIEEWYIAQ